MPAGPSCSSQDGGGLRRLISPIALRKLQIAHFGLEVKAEWNNADHSGGRAHTGSRVRLFSIINTQSVKPRMLRR